METSRSGRGEEQARQHIQLEKKDQKSRDIEERYDELLAEREQLATALSQYDFRAIQSLFFDVEEYPDEEITQLKDHWLKNVREKTTLFRGLDEMGIDVFAEDMSVQPGFIDTKIVYGSEDVLRREIKDMKKFGGQASAHQQQVSLREEHVPLRHRLAKFLKDGTFSEDMVTLIHELLHRYHQRKNVFTSGVATEAHAYFGEITGVGLDLSIVEIAHELHKNDEEAGLYGFSVKDISSALKSVTELYALGFTDSQIGDVIAKINEGKESDELQMLSAEVDREKKERGIDHIDIQSLDDIFRLHRKNELAKAQLALYQQIEKGYSQETLKNRTRDILRTQVSFPNTPFVYNDVVIEPPDWQFLGVLPCDEDYPYDFDGVRTMLGFAPLPGKTPDSQEYKIGKVTLEEGKDTIVDFADTKEEQAERIADLRAQIPLLNEYSKQLLFNNHLNLLASPELFSQEDMVLIESVLETGFSEDASWMLERKFEPGGQLQVQLDELNGILDAKQITNERLKYGLTMVDTLDRLKRIFPDVWSALQTKNETQPFFEILEQVRAKLTPQKIS